MPAILGAQDFEVNFTLFGTTQNLYEPDKKLK